MKADSAFFGSPRPLFVVGCGSDDDVRAVEVDEEAVKTDSAFFGRPRPLFVAGCGSDDDFEVVPASRSESSSLFVYFFNFNF